MTMVDQAPFLPDLIPCEFVSYGQRFLPVEDVDAYRRILSTLFQGLLDALPC